MTREEAIQKFEKQLTAAQAILDSGFGANPGESNRVYMERKEMAAIALEALREQVQSNEPLTIEELRQMNGEPVYWAEEEVWGIVKVSTDGLWRNRPFLIGHWTSVNFEKDIERRELKLYRRKPDKVEAMV